MERFTSGGLVGVPKIFVGVVEFNVSWRVFGVSGKFVGVLATFGVSFGEIAEIEGCTTKKINQLNPSFHL